jgi:hypothetical protein
MEFGNPFMTAAARKLSYPDYCKARDLHPCVYVVPGKSLSEIVNYARGMFVPAFAPYILMVLHRAWRIKTLIRRLVVPHLRRKMPAHTMLDLMMEPLASASPAHLLHIYADRKKYTFRIPEMLSIIDNALTHSTDFVSAPLAVKNPYTGVALSSETLYSIFVRVHESLFFMPPLFHSYVKTNFSLRRFTLLNECVLRDIIVKSTIKNLSPKHVHSEVRYMFEEISVFDTSTGMHRNIMPNPELLPARALDQFSQWLYAYYTHTYSFNPYMRNAATKSLVKAMVKFVHENPKFGRVVKGVVCTELTARIHPIPPF